MLFSVSIIVWRQIILSRNSIPTIVNRNRPSRPHDTMSSFHGRALRSNQATGLFTLPQELRDQIYYEVIFERREAKDRQPHNYQDTDFHLPPSEEYTGCTEWAPPALARVSKQLRIEVLDLFYRKARFIFHFRIPQTLDVLRKGLTYLSRSQPERVLKNLWINWRTMNIGWIEPFVGLAQVSGMFAKHIPKTIYFGTNPETRDLRKTLPKTCELLADVIDLGRSMNKERLKDRVNVRDDVMSMFCDESVDEEKRNYRKSVCMSFGGPGRFRPAME